MFHLFQLATWLLFSLPVFCFFAGMARDATFPVAVMVSSLALASGIAGLGMLMSVWCRTTRTPFKCLPDLGKYLGPGFALRRHVLVVSLAEPGGCPIFTRPYLAALVQIPGALFILFILFSLLQPRGYVRPIDATSGLRAAQSGGWLAQRDLCWAILFVAGAVGGGIAPLAWLLPCRVGSCPRSHRGIGCSDGYSSDGRSTF